MSKSQKQKYLNRVYELRMTEKNKVNHKWFEPDSTQQIAKVQDELVIKFLKLAHSDNDVNGECLNSPYFIKHNGKLYKASVKSHSSTGIKLSGLTMGSIDHVPMSEKE